MPPEPQRPARVLLAPVSFNQDVPELLEPGLEILREELARYLEGRGAEVVSPPLAAFHDQWLRAARVVSSESLYDEEGRFIEERRDRAAAAAVALFLEEGESFDAMVLPYLDVRQARLQGQSARWDGVTRRLSIEYQHHDRVHVSLGTGRIEATSLQLIVYARDGAKLLDHRGGLEPLLQIRVAQDFWYWEQREDLFEDREVLRDGIEVALRPYYGD